MNLGISIPATFCCAGIGAFGLIALYAICMKGEAFWILAMIMDALVLFFAVAACAVSKDILVEIEHCSYLEPVAHGCHDGQLHLRTVSRTPRTTLSSCSVRLYLFDLVHPVDDPVSTIAAAHPSNSN